MLCERHFLPKQKILLPKQIPPLRIEQDYASSLLRLLAPVFSAYDSLMAQVPSLMESMYGHRTDANEGQKVREFVEHVRETTRRTIRREAVEDLADKFAAQTSTYQRVQLNRQVHAALGTDPIYKDAGLGVAREQFVHENAASITRLPEELHGDVEAMVQHALSSAMPSPRLAKHIQARFGVTKRHAHLIARDQISKFHAKLNHKRQQELGIERFVWRSVGDDRVRDWHRDELDGNTYSFNKPPWNEDQTERIMPGDDVQCRCSAEPVFD